jgi:putative peptidoglycan lipid II flippase
MASGTLASRLTGQVRTILLAGALGVTGIAADAYQVGSQIPQVVFNLLAGGLLNAILVPQIVKAFKQHDYSSRINKLLTLSFIILLAVTFMLMIATPILVNIYVDSGWTPAQKALANAFTMWCMPQVFFYGLYTVLGQVLAAKDRFGAYAWSSVAANIVSCAGFGAFILFFGNAQRQPLNFWTPDKIALSAGTWTLGVAVQALILLVPLIKLGINLHPEFGFRGIGLRSMGQVAIWTLGAVILDQLLGIANTRITTGAPVATGDRLGTAGSQAYMQAYSIWILPYSLITVSLATAIFPRLSRAIAEHNVDRARDELSGSLRTSGVIMAFFSAAFIAIPIPIIRALLPSVGVHDASSMAIALLGLSAGLVPSSVTLLLRRAFYAFEDGRSPFLFALIQNSVQLVVLLTSVHFVDAHYWVGLVGISLLVSNTLLMPIAYMLIRRRMGGRIDGHRIARLYAKTAIAAVVTTFVGLFLSPLCQRLVGASLTGENPHMSWVQSVVISAIVGLVMLGVYAAALYLLKVSEFTDFLEGIMRRFTHRGNGGPGNSGKTETAAQTLESDATSPSEPSTTPQQQPVRRKPRIASSASTTLADGTKNGSVRHMIPAIGDTINNRYTLIALYRSEPGLSAWLANDHTLVRDCQLFIISDSTKLAKVNAIASSLALSKDSHFTHVLHLQKQSGVSIIVTETDAGVSLHEVLSSSEHTSMGIEAMRTIAGTVAEAANSLHKVSLNHQAISTHTIRLTSSAITLADAPVSPLLTTPIKASTFGDSEEMLSVRQIAAVLFEMITGTAFAPNADAELTRTTFEEHRNEIPAEFVSICTRALGIVQPDGSTPVPVFTLDELLALLGTWTKPSDLKKGELKLPAQQSGASIESVTLAPVDPRNIVDVPDSLVSADAVEEIPNAGEQQSLWSRNQLLFDGADAVEEINSDSPNFLSAFESSFHNSVDEMGKDDGSLTGDFLGVSQPTQALRVTHPTTQLSGTAQADTGETPRIVPRPSAASEAARSSVNATDATTAAGTSTSSVPAAESAPTVPTSGAAPLPSESEVEAAAEHAGSPSPRTAQSSGASSLAAQPQPEHTAAAARTGRSVRNRLDSANPTANTELQQSEKLAALAMRKEGSFDADELENPDFVDENVGEVTSILQPLSSGIQASIGGASDVGNKNEGSTQAAEQPPHTPATRTRTKSKSRATDGAGSGATSRRSMGRNVALVVAAIVMVVALVWAIFHLGITPLTTARSGESSSWSIDANTTPAPNGKTQTSTSSGTDSSSSSSDTSKSSGSTDKKSTTTDKKAAGSTDVVTTADKNAKKVPDPAVTPVTNTVAYPLSAVNVVRSSTISGVGVHVHLTQAQNVQRIRIISRTGGGKAAIYANATATDPNHGSALAEFTFKDNQQVTQVDLPQPVNTQDVVIWVSQQPTSGFYYQAVKVY